MTELAFLPPFFAVLFGGHGRDFGRKLVVPGAEFPGIPSKTSSKVKRKTCQPRRPALGSLLRKVFIISDPRRAVRQIGQRWKQALPRCEVIDEQVVRDSVLLCSLKSGLAGY